MTCSMSGKARALKNRVTNYTQVTKLPKRLQRMVSQTRSMTIVTTRTEAEALLLEAQLIKRFRPPYNVLLRDDKSFPFILLREDHPFPQVRSIAGRGGPRGSISARLQAPDRSPAHLMRYRSYSLLRSCSDSFFANRTRPCLLYQIRRCSAPCVGRISGGGLCRAGRGCEAVPGRQVDRGPGAARQADGRGGGEAGF